MAGFPDPGRAYPIVLPDGAAHKGTVFLNQVIDHPNFEIGDFTYASDFDPPEDWASRLAPYLFAGGPDRLVIGRYCQIASGVRFLTSGANHAMNGVTTFPFPIFDPTQIGDYRLDTRDVVIGNDVWLCYGAMICPGARIGDGVIVGAGTVVRGTVPDFSVVLGNPGKVVRMRFSETDISRLCDLAWWTWSADKVERAVPALLAGDIATLERLA